MGLILAIPANEFLTPIASKTEKKDRSSQETQKSSSSTTSIVISRTTQESLQCAV